MLFETGLEAIAAEPSFLTGVERTRWDGPLLRFVYSPADTVELDLEWVAAVGVLSGGDEPRTTDFGDITLRTKLRFIKGQGRRPTVSGRFGVVLPQTSYEDKEFRPLGLGPNTMRFWSAWEIVGEVAGRAGEGKPGAGQRSEARLGARYSRGRLRFDAALRRGLLHEHGAWGGTVGLS